VNREIALDISEKVWETFARLVGIFVK